MTSSAKIPAGLEDLPEAGKKGLALPALPPRLLAGSVLVIAGLVSVLIAWGQTRHLQNPAAQIPYLASGGLIGVGLMAVGAGLLGGGGPKVVTAAPSEEIVARVDGRRYETEMRILLLALTEGRPIASVPIPTLYLDGNRSSHYRPLGDSLRILRTVLRWARPARAGAGSRRKIQSFPREIP